MKMLLARGRSQDRLRLCRKEDESKDDHVNIKMPNGQLITIPVSRNLKIGHLKSAIRKARLDDDFL
jgi:hypothetical protein